MENISTDLMTESADGAIRKLIERIFGGTKYPGDKRIVVPPITPFEVQETLDLFRGYTWHQLIAEKSSVDDRRSCFDHIFFLTSLAFSYYLPALMIFTLGDAVVEPISSSTLEFCLAPANIPEWTQSVFNSLSGKQRECVVAYIEHMETTNGKTWNSPGAIEFWTHEG